MNVAIIMALLAFVPAQGEQINVEIELTAEEVTGKLRIVGKTNLPTGTVLSLSVTSGPFDRPLGTVHLSPLEIVQPSQVQPIRSGECQEHAVRRDPSEFANGVVGDDVREVERERHYVRRRKIRGAPVRRDERRGTPRSGGRGTSAT